MRWWQPDFGADKSNYVPRVWSKKMGEVESTGGCPWVTGHIFLLFTISHDNKQAHSILMQINICTMMK